MRSVTILDLIILRKFFIFSHIFLHLLDVGHKYLKSLIDIIVLTLSISYEVDA